MQSLSRIGWLAGILFCAATVPSRAVAADPAESSPKPNVIVIMTDDQGAWDVNCYGAKDLATPHMDGLARRGIRFTQFYAAAPVCSPSRAGLLTGRYPLRAGMPGNAPSEKDRPGMPASEVTMAEMFKAAGYATAHVGKWHLGYTPDTMPLGQGFDFSFGHMGGCIDNFSHFFYWQGPNRHDLWRNGEEVHLSGRYFPDLMVEEATDFLRKHRDRPFFLYFAINLPHYPYQGDAKWLTHYDRLPYPRNLYAAFISSLDERIGRLLAEVDELGLRERTIVLLQSDNGHSTEERAHFGGGNPGPYRGAKFSLFEGGIRLPAIMSWPGQLPENAVRDQMAHSCDWLLTLAELCGVRLLRQDIDGESLVPVLKSVDAPSPHRVLHWQTGQSWAVRQGDWKLLGKPQDTGAISKSREEKKAAAKGLDELFLVNLNNDISEQRNVADQHPELVRRLKTLHEDWEKAVLAERNQAAER